MKHIAREGVQSRYEPHKIVSRASWPDAQNDLQAPQKPSLCLLLRLLASAILSPLPEFWSLLAVLIISWRFMA